MTPKSTLMKIQVPIPHGTPRGAAAASTLMYGLFRAVQSIGTAAMWSLRAVGVLRERTPQRRLA